MLWHHAICKQSNLIMKSNGKEYDKAVLLYKQEWGSEVCQYGGVMKPERYRDDNSTMTAKMKTNLQK